MAIIMYWSRWHKMAKQPKLHQFCGHPIIPISSLFWFPNHAWENKSCVSEIETRDRYLAARLLRPPPPPDGGVTLPRPNGCHFYKNVFNRFFVGVHLHALHKLNGRAIAQFLHLPAWKWFQLGQLGLQQRSTWTCLVTWQFQYCQVEWVLVAIPPERQI